MNKNIFSIVALSALIFPAVTFAQFGEKMREQQGRLEQKVLEKKQQLTEKTAERAQKLEEKAKERQEKTADRVKRTEERKEAEKKNFCENIVDRMAERQSDFTERQSEFTEKKTERLEERKADREENDLKVAEKRAAAAERRAKMYQNLLNQADTDEEKAAVAAFQATVEQAVKDREAAIDAARTTFRNGIDAAKASRKADGTEALAAFKAAMQNALAEAKADCAADGDQATIRSEYQTALKSAQEALAESRGKNGIGDTVSELAKTRTTAVKAALTAYRTTLEEAFNTLKDVFGDAQVAPEETPETSSGPAE